MQIKKMSKKMPNFFDNTVNPVTPTHKIELKPVATQKINRKPYEINVQVKSPDLNKNNEPNQPTPSIIDNTQFELEQINMKINSLLHALDDIQTDIVKYKVDKRAEQEALQNQSISVTHYFRAFLMFMICIGIPWFIIEVFSWRF